jgi:ABC-type branched-subunit amino acid transport system substrate-binding protein
MEGLILSQYANEALLDQSLAILYPADLLGGSAHSGFTRFSQVETVADESYMPTVSSIDTQLDVIHEADPDVLLLLSSTEFSVLAYQYMAENDWRPLVVLSNVNDPDAIAAEVGLEALTGAITTQYLLDPGGADPAVRDHAQIMDELGGPAVDSASLYAQAIAETVVQTLDIACEDGDLTRAGIKDASRQVEGFHPTTLVEGIDVILGPADQMAVESLLPVELQADGTLASLTDGPLALGAP